MKNNSPIITLAHGAGGRLTHELVSTVFKPAFSNPALNSLDDAAELLVPKAQRSGRLAFTTDSFVVTPLFFPGGDIGRLAVCGTVNDLAMKGARPLALSVAAIIEEGLEISVVRAVVRSIARAAKEAGVAVVTGDTKVVERGKADKLFITTSGVGIIPDGVRISGAYAKAGDSVIVSGTMGDHGIAVIAARNDFKLNSPVKSDCAPLSHLSQKLLAATRDQVHVMRDPTRGGLATTLNEIASSSNVGIIIDEKHVPVLSAVRAACSILGFDPLYLANEGKMLAILPAARAQKAVSAMKSHTYGKNAAVVGTVVKEPRGVWLKTFSGGLRPLAMQEGEQLPRIC